MQPLSSDVFIVMPVFNEGPVLHEVLSSLTAKGYKVIVVDDGSDESLKQSLTKYPLYFLRHQANLGQGAALQTGFEFAKKLDASLVVCMDADGQHGVEEIPALVKPLREGSADIVLGSRFLSADTKHIPLARIVLIKLARIINYLFSGMMLTDAHNGFRAFNKLALEKMMITENRMAHATEILFEIKKHGLRFEEIPVHIAYTPYSRSKGQSTWQSVRILFDIILHKLFK